MTDLVPSNNLSSIDIKTDQIASCHETKMFSKMIHPNVVLKFRIANRDVAGLTFREAFPGEVSEHRRSMD
jgi:hypothetical protein